MSPAADSAQGQRQPPTAHRLLNLAGFYLGWFACVGGVADGNPSLGPLVVACLLAVHLWLTADVRGEVLLLLAVGILGFTIDTLSAWSRIYAFVATPRAFLCPPWLLALWLVFGSTLNVSFAWLARRYALAAVLGAAAGPLSYYTAARLGVITFPDPFLGIALLAAIWAVIMPTLLYLAGALASPNDTSPSKRQPSGPPPR